MGEDRPPIVDGFCAGETYAILLLQITRMAEDSSGSFEAENLEAETEAILIVEDGDSEKGRCARK